MMVFQFVKDNSAIHRKITECLMSQKDDLLKDILCVVAHGTPGARAPAADLLFYYWPRWAIEIALLIVRQVPAQLFWLVLLL